MWCETPFCFCVNQSEVAIVERCGKFTHVAAPGLQFRVPCLDTVRGICTLRLQHLELQMESKTNDNVFVRLRLQIQYQVIPSAVDAAFYSMSHPRFQIENYARHHVRGIVPLLTLEQLFLERNEISSGIQSSVGATMTQFGYDIQTVLLLEIDPKDEVDKALNSIVVLDRMEKATKDAAAAEATLKIRRSEAEAEAMKQSAMGVAGMRRAIMMGLRDSIESFKDACPQLLDEHILSLLLVTQYLDTIAGCKGGTKDDLLYISHAPNYRKVMRRLLGMILQSRPTDEEARRCITHGVEL